MSGAGPLYSNTTSMTEATARGILCKYFADWRPGPMFVTKLVQALSKEELEKIVNDGDLKFISGYNRDEKLVIDY